MLDMLMLFCNLRTQVAALDSFYATSPLMRFQLRFSAVILIFLSAESCGCFAEERKKERNLFATNNINIKQEKHNIKVSS